MNSLDNTKRLAELLKLAREALNDEFLKQQMERHQAWLVACNQAWITKGMLLPYTTTLVYPTEKEIVARAVTIYNELNPAEQAVIEATNAPVLDAEEVAPAVEETATDGIIEQPIVEEVAPVTEEPVIATPGAEKIKPAVGIEDKFKSLFTKWGGRGSLPEDTN